MVVIECLKLELWLRYWIGRNVWLWFRQVEKGWRGADAGVDSVRSRA